MAKQKLPAAALAFFREQGRRGGKMGAAARMVKLTPEQRSEIARNAVAAREAKRRRKAKAAPEGHSTKTKAGR